MTTNRITSQNGKAKAERSFPRITLEAALKIARAIKEKNAGNPWPPEEVARAVGYTLKSTNFFYLTAGSRDYGLTEGTARASTIKLTELGKAVVYPPNSQAETEAKRKALLTVESFRKVLQHYRGNNLPEMQYLANTLEKEFHIPPEFHSEFVDLFQKNCRFVRIGADFQSSERNPSSPTTTNGSATETPPTVTLAEPARGDGKLCFVVMPFVEKEDRHPTGFFEEVLDSLIVPAAKEAGFVVRSANREGSDVIQSTIVNDLLHADLVLADLTEHNPNVLFELGMRMAEDKPVALIRANGTGRIFDVDNMLRVYEYNPCLWPSTVAMDLPALTAHIKASWANRDSDCTYLKLLKRAVVPTPVGVN